MESEEAHETTTHQGLTETLSLSCLWTLYTPVFLIINAEYGLNSDYSTHSYLEPAPTSTGYIWWRMQAVKAPTTTPR